MKILKYLPLVAILLAACNQHQSQTVIKTSDDTHSLKVSYSGRMVFDSSKTRVLDMAPHAYLTVEKDDDEIRINADKEGKMTYEINGHSAVTALNEGEQQIMAQGISLVVKQQQGR